MELKDKDSLGEAFRLLQEMRAVDTEKGWKRFEEEISSHPGQTIYYRLHKVFLYVVGVLFIVYYY
ncbi:MAG: hypothetical protein LIO97_06865 [Tannerellaceae bacterium]|nr:hypothetical protein [Tannerellaceae bacterium]